ncbi:hypothetical protein BSAF29S_00266 [Bacillus safensis subsp. safensis]
MAIYILSIPNGLSSKYQTVVVTPEAARPMVAPLFELKYGK